MMYDDSGRIGFATPVNNDYMYDNASSPSNQGLPTMDAIPKPIHVPRGGLVPIKDASKMSFPL